jgi:hypothetical protein
MERITTGESVGRVASDLVALFILPMRYAAENLVGLFFHFSVISRGNAYYFFEGADKV